MLKDLNTITLQEPRKKLCLIYSYAGIPATLLKALDLNAASQ
jgi:hypothetical protein